MKNSHNKDNNENKHTTTKLIICIIIIIIIILLLITSCTSSFWGKIGTLFGNIEYNIGKDNNDKREINNKNLYFDIQEATITLDDASFKLTYSYKDINAKDVVCSTSDAEVATCVAYDGYVVVNPKKAGIVTIYATTTFNDIVYKATSYLTINEGKNGIRLSQTSGNIILANGNKKNVAYNLIGIKGNVNVSVEDSSIATATAKNGILSIKALKAGSTKITLTVKYGDKTYKVDYYLTVLEKDQVTTKDSSTNKDTKLKLNVSFKQMYVKDTYQIKVLSGKAVRWESSDKKVATVSKKGKVTAKKAGSVDIIAYDAKGNKAIVRINVIEKDKKSKIELSVSNLTLKVGEEFTPQVLKGKVWRWKSSNKSIATVDKHGKITAKKVGTVTITASDFFGFNKATITVNVIDSNVPTNPDIYENLELETNKVDLSIGAHFQIRVNKGYPVSYSSSNTNVATVTQDGIVVAVGEGSAIITVVGINGEIVNMEVSVKKNTTPVNPTEKIELRNLNRTISVRDEINLSEFVLSGTPKYFVVSDPSKAIIENGKIIFKEAGTITLTAYDADGNKSSITIVIEDYKEPVKPIPNLVVDSKNIDMLVGDVQTIKILAGKPTSFKSSDTSVLTVDNDGRITALKTGNASVTITGVNGETVTVNVNVKKKPSPVNPDSAILLKAPGKTIFVGDVLDLSHIIKEGTPTEWHLSNNIAEINAGTGKITFKSPGMVTITAKDKNGNSSSITIVVESKYNPDEPISDLVISNTNISLTVGDVEQINKISGIIKSCVSNDTNVVTVDNAGYITAVGAGNTTVIVEGYNGEKVTITVEVKNKKPVTPTDEEKDIKLDKTKTTMMLGDKYTLRVLEGVASSWSSSNSDILFVDNSGYLVASNEKVGTVTITVTGKNGSKDSITITVVAKKIELSSYEKNLYVGSTFKPVITSNNYGSATWSSVDGSIATVDNNGNIKAISPGVTTIKVTNASGIETEVHITVLKYVLDKLNIKLEGVNTPFNFKSNKTSYEIPDVAYETKKLQVEGILPSDKEYDGITVKYELNGTEFDGDADLENGTNTLKVKLFAKDENGNDVLVNEYTVTINKLKNSSVELNLYHGSEEILPNTSDPYKIDNKENPLELKVEKASGSIITEVLLIHDDVSTNITEDFKNTSKINLNEGVSTLQITVVSEDGKNSKTYSYNLERLKRNIKIEFDEHNLEEFDIDDSPITFAYSITEDDLPLDYAIGDVEVLLDGVKSSKLELFEGIIKISPTPDDIGKHTITVNYKGYSNSFDITITEDTYVLDTCNSGICNYKYEADFTKADQSVLDKIEITNKTTIPLYTNILKYDKDGKPNYVVDDSTDGRIVIKNSTYDKGEVVITYNSAAKITFVENKTDSDYYVLDVSLETGEDVFIKVEAYRYGHLVKTLDDIQIRVTKKYLLVVNAVPHGETNEDDYFLDAESRKQYINFLRAEEKFDLKIFDPYKVDNTQECFTYKFLAWTDEAGNTLISKDDLDKPVVLNDAKPSLVLYASYEGTSALDTDPIYGYVDLKDIDLFRSSNNEYKDIDEKLIYPGLEGGKGITFNNTYGSDLNIVQLIVQEDTLCVSDNACLNMGYKIRKYEDDRLDNTYYYGSANSYQVLYEDSELDSNTYSPYYHSYKEIGLGTDKIHIDKDKSADIAVFWKWVDRDDIDSKIGNMAFDLNKYRFFLSVKFEKPKNKCTIIQ